MIVRDPGTRIRFAVTHAVAFFVAAWACPVVADVSLEWQGADGKARAVVSGLDESWFASHERASWKDRLAVYPGSPAPDSGLPPMLGKHAREGDQLVFTPLFPLQLGIRYQAFFFKKDGAEDPLTAAYQVPEPDDAAPTVVTGIYPSAGILPENLLKFYVHFSAPMSRGHIYEHIRLTDSEGSPIELPFLEIDEELWNPEMTRVTLFIDPGRIKRGVKPLEDIGPALEEGKAYTLNIDAAWRDALHRPLKEAFRKPFQVGRPDRQPPEPRNWEIRAPAEGGREPLEIVFTDPMDHALALRMIHVIRGEKALEGEAALIDEERRWRFVPSEFWESGTHELLVQTAIEDLAGNNIGKPFEVDLEGPVERQLEERSVRLPFTVGSSTPEERAPTLP